MEAQTPPTRSRSDAAQLMKNRVDDVLQYISEAVPSVRFRIQVAKRLVFDPMFANDCLSKNVAGMLIQRLASVRGHHGHKSPPLEMVNAALVDMSVANWMPADFIHQMKPVQVVQLLGRLRALLRAAERVGGVVGRKWPAEKEKKRPPVERTKDGQARGIKRRRRGRGPESTTTTPQAAKAGPGAVAGEQDSQQAGICLRTAGHLRLQTDGTGTEQSLVGCGASSSPDEQGQE